MNNYSYIGCDDSLLYACMHVYIILYIYIYAWNAYNFIHHHRQEAEVCNAGVYVFGHVSFTYIWKDDIAKFN